MPSGHLLVVDDEASILSTLKTVLSLEGYTVDVAATVAQAQSRLSKCAYDLAVFDVALPDGNGVNLLEQVRASNNDMPVVMMSGHATVDAAVRATRLGASDFLEKPISTDRLLLVLENTLRLVRVEAEASVLRSRAGLQGDLVGSSEAMQSLRAQIARAARANATVLVRGERGTGKELVARAIHKQSKRADQVLEKLNCAAVPRDLIESELFGHEAGAFTGATKQRRGKFERANGGTIFLDEVGDMPIEMQVKLLRVLQEREIERVGGSEVIQVDVRVVAATNRDLEKACEDGGFRADLFDRLNVLPLTLPPLRARASDISELAEHFLSAATKDHDRPDMHFDDSALARIASYPFPGNVRELRNLIERLVILTPDDTIQDRDVDQCLGPKPKTKGGMYRAGVPFKVLVEEAERAVLTEAIKHHDGNMAATARGLGLERSHLYKKCRALGIRD